MKRNVRRFFFDGQIFDAFSLLTNIITHAQKEIILIDGYIDIITLNILAKKNIGVNVYTYTLPNTKLSAQDIANFNAQYPTLTVKKTASFHDRFLIIDGKEGYHIGASLKDAGKKCFGINRIEGVEDIKDIITKSTADREIKGSIIPYFKNIPHHLSFNPVYSDTGSADRSSYILHDAARWLTVQSSLFRDSFPFRSHRHLQIPYCWSQGG